MKGNARIGGALALGILIILGALNVQKSGGDEALAGQVIVSAEPNRTYIETKDSDADGINDWEEDLHTGIFETIDTPTQTPEESESYVPPTTFTGKFSEAFFKDYMDGKMNGADFSDPTEFIGKAVGAIDANSQSKRHSRLELSIVSDSDEAIHAYGNEVAKIMKIHSAGNKNEAAILQKALTTNDPSLLESLIPVHAAYEAYIVDTLSMEVPQSFVSIHIDLLNTYESILTDIEAMQMAFTDPLYSLARVKGYETDASALYNTLKSIAENLSNAGVSYTNDEDGALFYIFEI
ncbi:MAG: hypothetical protein WAW13_03240 [Minisyncoccia bacterium]